MSWDIVNPNILDLYCNKLNCNSVGISTDTSGTASVGASFYTGSAPSAILQRSGITVRYLVFGSIMYISMSSSTGYWNVVNNPSGTGWSSMQLSNYNGGSPLGLQIPYKVNSNDNLFYTTAVLESPAQTFYQMKVSIFSKVGGVDGSWNFSFNMMSPATQFINGQSQSISNFCLVVPVTKV